MEIITCHKNIDFDALASVFAASMFYPDALPILPTSCNPNIRAFLSIHKNILPFYTPKEIRIDDIKKMIVVDTNSWSRLEGLSALKNNPDVTIDIWDHHGDTGDIDADWVCSEPVGATVSLLIRRMEKEGLSLSPIPATLFLAGIYEDTGNLTFPATTSTDASAVAFLLRQKADLGIIDTYLRPVYGPKQKDILFEMLKNAPRRHINGRSISISHVHMDGHTPGLALVVNMYQDIINVDAAFGIFTGMKRDACMVIGRGSGEGLDIGDIMRRLGGGGHQNAGSAMVKTTSPEAVEKRIFDLLNTVRRATVHLRDLMSFPVHTSAPDVPMKQVALMLRETGCSGLPVVDNETVVGIISRRDFKRMKKESQIDAPVKAFMSGSVILVDADMPVNKAVQLMVKRDIGRLPVVEDGKLIGIVTRSDMMSYYYDLLPEEVPHGDIVESGFMACA